MIVSCKIETANFMAGQRLLHGYSKTMPSEALHRSVAFVLEDAKDLTPVTTTARIESDLQVTTTPRLVTRGARLGLPRKDKAVDIHIGDKDTVAMRIMLARLHPYSDYNVLTDGRYRIDRKTFSPGMGVAGFWARLRLRAQAMVKARRSSSGFFRVTWNPLIAQISDFVPARFKSHFLAVAGGKRSIGDQSIGALTAAQSNSPYAFVKIENRVGMDDKYPVSNALRNAAAHRVLGPVLQRAIDRGFDKQMAEAARRGILDAREKLKALGFAVR